jgi:hypothetical protein
VDGVSNGARNYVSHGVRNDTCSGDCVYHEYTEGSKELDRRLVVVTTVLMLCDCVCCGLSIQ